MPAAVVTYEGTPGRDPATDVYPVPGVEKPLRAGTERVIDDHIAAAAGGTSGVEFAKFFTYILNGSYDPPILHYREVSDEEAQQLKAAAAAAEHEADPLRAEHDAVAARREQARTQAQAPQQASPAPATGGETVLPDAAPSTPTASDTPPPATQAAARHARKEGQ